jgi:hypothetical protein
MARHESARTPVAAARRNGRNLNREAPEQYAFDFALWTIETIREVIQRLFQVTMSGVSVWRTLKALGLSAQRPRHVAYQQNEEAVQEFLKKEYPEIKKEAKSAVRRCIGGMNLRYVRIITAGRRGRLKEKHR